MKKYINCFFSISSFTLNLQHYFLCLTGDVNAKPIEAAVAEIWKAFDMAIPVVS